MKLLTLMRHAKSSHDDPARHDFFRTLDDRGRRDAPRMSRHLREEFKFAPDRILCSPATRTQATARCLADALGRDFDTVKQDRRIYEAPVTELIDVLQEIDDQFHHVCLIGHNPGMENLTNWMVGERIITGFVTCGVAMLELRINSWEELRAKCAKLMHYLRPKDLWDVSDD